MTWKKDAPQGDEQNKIRWEIVPYTRGKVLDIGCGPNKAFPHFIGVDNGHHTRFGYSIRPDMWSEADDLWFAKSQAYDAVFSSHTLEHMEDYKKTLKEWWRVIKLGGFLLLYLPHKDFYPNIGEEGANPDHKHDFLPDDIIEAMKEIGPWELVDLQERNQDNEYSFLIIFRKTTWEENERILMKHSPDIQRILTVKPGALSGLGLSLPMDMDKCTTQASQ